MNPIAESLAIFEEHLQAYSRTSPKRFSQEIAAKSVIITGGGYGIGAAVARAYGEAHIKEVIIVGRTQSRLEETVSELSKTFSETTFSCQVVDITIQSDVSRFFKGLHYSPDILVNNAGYMATPANFLEADIEEFWKTFQVNVFGTALFTQSYLQHRESHVSPDSPVATIISLNTVGSYYIRVPGLASYAASKAALARLNEMMAVDIPSTVARFISLHPGAVHTNMAVKSGLKGAFPVTESELAASFIVFCSTEQASFLNGRFAWVNWDVDKLLAKKDDILSKDLLRTSLTG